MTKKSKSKKSRSQEDVVTLVSLLAALTLLIWAHIGGSGFDLPGLLEKVAFATIVAVAVRRLALLYEESKAEENVYDSSVIELYEHLDKAQERIWICQTWLPSTAADAQRILERGVADTQLLLASFKPGSPIYARIPARVDANTPEHAKLNSASSVLDFVKEKREGCVRFNPIHHPGWIAVIDDYVFWGATPVDKDNWAVRILFHKAHKRDVRAKFWIEQFGLLWDGINPKTNERWSHDYATECQYNEYLEKYVCKELSEGTSAPTIDVEGVRASAERKKERIRRRKD